MNGYPPLGLGPLPMPVRIFVGQEQGQSKLCAWYTLEGDRRVAIEEAALTGYVRELRIVPKSSERHGDTVKLDIAIEADKPYIIRSGVETNFTRGIVLALSEIDSLDKPITIAAVPGDESKTVFGQVYQHGSRIFAEWNGQADVQSLIVRLANKLGQASVHSNHNGNGKQEAATAVVSAGLATPTAAVIPANKTQLTAAQALGTVRTTTERMSVPGQHRELERLAGLRGWPLEYLDAESRSRYSWPHEQLTFHEALKFTGELKQ